MAKTPTTTETTAAPTETTAAPEGAGLDAAAATTDPAPEAPVTLPGEGGEGGDTEGGEAVPPVGETSAYEQAEAFQPDPWDQLPEDPEVRRLYLAIHGDVNFFVR